jgi:hypothetical protein
VTRWLAKPFLKFELKYGKSRLLAQDHGDYTPVLAAGQIKNEKPIFSFEKSTMRGSCKVSGDKAFRTLYPSTPLLRSYMGLRAGLNLIVMREILFPSWNRTPVI